MSFGVLVKIMKISYNKRIFYSKSTHSISEAAAKIKAITGIERGETQVRKFMKYLGFRSLTVGTVPAKALAQYVLHISCTPKLYVVLNLFCLFKLQKQFVYEFFFHFINSFKYLFISVCTVFSSFSKASISCCTAAMSISASSSKVST